MRLHAFQNAVMDFVIDRSAGQTADFEQVSALGLKLRHLFDFLLAHILEVDHDAVGAGFGHDAVEGDDDDAGVAGLLDGAVERVGRAGVDDDRVIALKNQILDLGGLGRDFLVGGGENVGGGDDLVGDGLLRHDAVALQHRLTPGIAGVIVGKGDLQAAGVGESRSGEQGSGEGKRQECGFHRFPPCK